MNKDQKFSLNLWENRKWLIKKVLDGATYGDLNLYYKWNKELRYILVAYISDRVAVEYFAKIEKHKKRYYRYKGGLFNMVNWGVNWGDYPNYIPDYIEKKLKFYWRIRKILP